MDTIYELKEPIKFGSEEISRLVFKPLKAKHLRNLKGKEGFDETLVIASRLTGVSEDILDEMGIEDVRGVAQVIQSFLKSGHETGPAITQP